MTKRFYKSVELLSTDEGYQVTLDGRPIKSPLKNPVLIPSAELARHIAREWEIQGDELNHDSLRATKLATTITDQLPAMRDDAVREITTFLDTDLLFYRAIHPDSLVARQSKTWDPPLAWAQRHFGVTLPTTSGIDALELPATTRQKLVNPIHDLGDWRLMGLHAATRTTGSLILGLAALHRQMTPQAMLEAACLDELYSRDNWGAERELDRRLESIKADIDTFIDWFTAIGDARI